MPTKETQFGRGANDRPDDFFSNRSWRHEEIAGAFQPAIWKEKKIEEFVTYPKRNQYSQNSCVSYVLAKQLAVDELSENGAWRELSPRSIYAYTYNPNGGGSSSLEATKLVVKQGMTLESLLDTDGLGEINVRSTESYLTDAKQIALVYKPASFVECSSDFETIASIIQGHRDQGIKKIVAATIIGQNNGTWLSTMPVIPKNYNGLWYHRIAITDFGILKGKKVLSFDNSWGNTPGNAGQQFLTEDHQPFLYGAIYTLNQPDNWQQLGTSAVQPPTHQWYNDLGLGSTGPDVTALQLALQSMGMFPITSIVKPTGAYWGITKKGVEMFQSSMGLMVTGLVNKETRAKLNAIFK